MYAIRIISPIIIVCVKKERWGITLLYGYQKMRRNPHLLYALLYVSKSGVRNEVPTKKPIAKVNKKSKLVNPYEKSINKTTGRDIKFIFVCVLPDGIMHFLAYVRPVIL
ncbi:hypothetical protein bcere0026_49450 [Bacillus mycoides]|uniref:Uncharacterized protein n=1 Tax=Bacillus mycoides TaxID=1405 RepID=C2Y1V0_BACMY|nr:hypothetical protein bcere0014_49150 [Bacillus cereus BDRD-ST196]EEL68104.1 hypothetical protein bcere0026_49450 [Bacillus mycoides]